MILVLNACSKQEPYSKKMMIRDHYFNGHVKVEKIAKLNKFRVQLLDTLSNVIDQIYTPHEISLMEQGDINNDGRTDICLCICKPTPFDPVLKKRLFIFQIDKGYIRPLWLGSRLVRPFEHFKVCRDSLDEYTIKSLERQDKNNYCISTYKWKSFGMSYVATENDSLTYDQAIEILN